MHITCRITASNVPHEYQNFGTFVSLTWPIFFPLFETKFPTVSHCTSTLMISDHQARGFHICIYITYVVQRNFNGINGVISWCSNVLRHKNVWRENCEITIFRVGWAI